MLLDAQKVGHEAFRSELEVVLQDVKSNSRQKTLFQHDTTRALLMEAYVFPHYHWRAFMGVRWLSLNVHRVWGHVGVPLCWQVLTRKR